jgi:hypothetical protein
MTGPSRISDQTAIFKEEHMKSWFFQLLSGVLFAIACVAGSAFAWDPGSLAPNQTMGFGNNKLLKFTYKQNYDCVDQPRDDLDFNGVLAQSDPAEFQTPICQAAIEPTIDPPGRKVTKNTAHLYVLVPMFSLDNDQNPNDAIACPVGVRSATLCGSALGSTLISLFGAVPEGFKTNPMVFTQCPDPGTPPGTCTMHSSTVDLGIALVALKKLPPPAKNVFVPTPNHSHVIDNDLINSKAIWWEVRPVLVMNPSDWPPQDGSSGITSVEKMDDAEKEGDAIEVPSNFFLFFSSKIMRHMKMD